MSSHWLSKASLHEGHFHSFDKAYKIFSGQKDFCGFLINIYSSYLSQLKAQQSLCEIQQKHIHVVASKWMYMSQTTASKLILHIAKLCGDCVPIASQSRITCPIFRACLQGSFQPVQPKWNFIIPLRSDACKYQFAIALEILPPPPRVEMSARLELVFGYFWY